MPKSKALVASEEKVAALEARIKLATEVYRNQKAQIRELEAQLAARGAAKVIPTSVTTYVDRAGRTWEKVRTGNTARSRLVEAEAA
jgi:P2-related tail formation protein